MNYFVQSSGIVTVVGDDVRIIAEFSIFYSLLIFFHELK